MSSCEAETAPPLKEEEQLMNVEFHTFKEAPFSDIAPPNPLLCEFDIVEDRIDTLDDPKAKIVPPSNKDVHESIKES
jgi:hypothetical protein